MSKYTAINSIARTLARKYGKGGSWAITGDPQRTKFLKDATNVLHDAEIEGYQLRDIKDKFYDPYKVLTESKLLANELGEYFRELDNAYDRMDTKDKSMDNAIAVGREITTLRDKLFTAYIRWGIELDGFIKSDKLDMMIADLVENRVGKFCTKAGHNCKDAICGNCSITNPPIDSKTPS